MGRRNEPAPSVEPSTGVLAALVRSLDPTDPQRAPHPNERIIGIGAALIVLVMVSGVLLRTAFHIDDPLFIWAARQIQAHPTNPYGFSVNWYGFSMSMSDVQQNPPLTSYYIALAASLFGWSEPALHVAFLLPALAVGVGTYLIAERLCNHPLLATLAAVLTPVVFVSSQTVMSDMLTLGFWVFAAYFWMRGLDEGGAQFLGLGGLCIGIAAISKYFGMTLIPLLVVYTIVKQRRLDRALLYFVIPVGILAWYQVETRELYGRGLLLDAAAYATQQDSAFGRLSFTNAYVDLAFTGGCIASVAFFAGHLWSRRTIALGGLAGVCLAGLFAAMHRLGSFVLPSDMTAHLLLALQLALWGVAGLSLIVICVLDFSQSRDAESLLLLLWTLGTFVFAGFVNWTINGRSLLPLAVPAGILMTRRMERRVPSTRQRRVPPIVLPLTAAAMLASVVVWADSRLADTARTAAERVSATYDSAGRPIWFQGHWGFQYYMERTGAKPIDVRAPQLSRGDIVVVPETNTNLVPMPSDWSSVRQTFDIPAASWVSTMNSGVGAGFYADAWGPLPFVFAPVPPERITVFDVTR